MTAGAAGKLYTTELLSLATELSAFPLTGDWVLAGEARSRTCGSSIRIGIEPDDQGRIGKVGLAVTACAVGQGAATIFAREAHRKNAGEIATALEEIENWLEASDASAPQWPGFSALDAARAHPGRHGALLLPWKAAVDALCKAGDSR
ncbi:iron-sulfur cluster assembly scaffold protein [Altererythrobacter litoralis]|uniref:Iron-sulfur cluster assembly scaffold protein n=1 Tax=Altererythrobacter litoralis TaxID=3113904 RepID=A0ABU7GBH6_9SPHN|nr:iron-sulfur cluster assembly scaffold protein [Erythrobacteraceae bacterium 1XM1-14]